MASEEESVSTAAMADAAAERARRLILVLRRYEDALDVADAVANGARRGAMEAVSGRPPTMSRADADMYAAAAASGAVQATLTAIANCLTGPNGSLNAPCVVEDEITMAAARPGARLGAKAASKGNILSRHFILVLSVVMAVVSVLVVVFRVV